MTSTTSRRALLTAAAALPALTVPALATAEADPIFATIEAHRRAWRNLDGCSDLDAAASQGDKEAERKLDRLNAALDDATDKLLEPPTTIAGCAAVLAYAAAHVVGPDAGQWPDGEAWISRHGVEWQLVLHRNLAKALEAMA